MVESGMNSVIFSKVCPKRQKAYHCRLYFSKVLAARKKNLTTARACKNKHTARMLANARKDHSILLQLVEDCTDMKLLNEIMLRFGNIISLSNVDKKGQIIFPKCQ